MNLKNQKATAGILFFLSGAVGLIYQISWIKILSLQLGASAWSISTVVAAFMAGLGIGSWWAGQRVNSWSRPFRTYGYIELGIAVFGVLSLPALNHIDVLMRPLYSAFGNQFGFFVAARLFLVFLILLIPTALMGASLPVLVVGVSRFQGFEGTVGLLYGINTLGAAIGVVSTGFLLLPQIGIKMTILVACMLGLLVGAIAVFWDKNFSFDETENLSDISQRKSGKIPLILLLAVFISGVTSIFYEISWTRLLAPIFGSSTYAFSIILTTFLIGIGAGSLLAAQPWWRVFRYRSLLAVLFVVNSIAVVAGLYLVNYLPELFLKLGNWSNERAWMLFLGQGAITSLLMLIPTVLMGISLPIAILGFNSESGERGQAVGKIYLSNTMGSILGSLLAGFVVLPWIGAPKGILLASVICVIFAVFLVRSDGVISRIQKDFWLLAGFAFILLTFVFGPKINMRQLHAGAFRSVLIKGQTKIPQQPDLLFIKEGHNCTVTVYRSDYDTFLKVNGKTDASSHGDLSTQYMLGHLPLFMHASPSKVGIIGLGSGATARAVSEHPVERIDVVELEPAVVEATKYFRAINNNVLTDPRVHLHLEDGRTFLKYQPQKFDVIISEPSNPWVIGVSALFTTEYYSMVKKRLEDGGIFCQWIQFYEMSQETLNTMLRTLADSFPHVSLFVYSNDLVCLASMQPIRRDAEQFKNRFTRSGVAKTLRDISVENEYDLLNGYLGSLPEDNQLYEVASRNTDNNLWLEYRAPIEMHKGLHPQFKPLPYDIFANRFHSLFFSEKNRDEVILNLSESIAKNRFNASHRIAGLKSQTKTKSIVDMLTLLEVKAKEKLKHIGESAEKNTEAGRIIDAKGELNEAISLLKEALEKDPTNVRAKKFLALASLNTSRFDDALNYSEQALEQNSEDYVSWVRRGTCLLYKNNLSEGEQSYLKAVDLNPFYLSGWAHLHAFYVSSQRGPDVAALEQKILKSFNKSTFDLFKKSSQELSAQKPFVDVRFVSSKK